MRTQRKALYRALARGETGPTWPPALLRPPMTTMAPGRATLEAWARSSCNPPVWVHLQEVMKEQGEREEQEMVRRKYREERET